MVSFDIDVCRGRVSWSGAPGGHEASDGRDVRDLDNPEGAARAGRALTRSDSTTTPRRRAGARGVPLRRRRGCRGPGAGPAGGGAALRGPATLKKTSKRVR